MAHHAVEGSDGMEWCAYVVAKDGGQGIRCWADDGDLPCGFEGQCAVVLEQDDAFLGGFARGLAIGVGGDGGKWDAIERAWRIEHAELEASCVKAYSGLRYEVFGDESMAHGV